MTTSSKVIEKLKQEFQAQVKTMEVKNPENDQSEDNRMETILPYRLGYLTDAMFREADVELHETEDVKTSCLVELRSLIENEPNLVSKMDDNFLLPFLRSRKYNVKKAFKLLQNFWTFRKEHKDIYDNPDEEGFHELIQRNFMGFLRERDKHGSVVLIIKIGLWNPELDTYEHIFRALTGVLLHSIEDPATQVAGYRIIVDARGLTWNQMKFLTPQNLILLIRSTQHCFPARYKMIHILSENKLFNFAWAIVHPFLTKKLKKRIVLHGSDLSALKEHIHPSVLPVEYGGEHAVFDNSSWTDTINQDKGMVMELLNYGYK